MPKRPPVAINPHVPVEVQRELRKVYDVALDAHQTATVARDGLATKLDNSKQALMQISQFVSGQVQADGAHPITLTGLPLGPSGVKAGTYTVAGITSITVDSSGRVIKIS